MKKILILANSSGGLYDFRNELLIELLGRYAVTASLPDDVRTKELSDEGVKVIHTDINRRGVNPKEDMALIRAYKKLLKDEAPDLVLTYTIKPNIYGGYCAQRLKIPYIETITGLGSTFQKKGALKALIISMYRAGLKGAECVFFQNSENMRIFEQLGIAAKKRRLVNGSGVNLKKHNYEEYPAAGDTVRFLYIGRTMKEKGTDELLAAASYFADKEALSENKSGVKPEFLFLGYPDEDYQEKLDDYEKKGYIRQLGFDPDVHKYIKEAHAVVLPTYHEGMSNVLQEAAAVGRPVIASDIPGCREIFEDKISGLACKPRDEKSLIEAIESFLCLTDEERARMGMCARRKVEREFDRESIVNAYLEEIERCLSLKENAVEN